MAARLPGEGSWSWPAALALASAALLGALAWGPLFPTGDGPQHVMMGHIESHFDEPGSVYRYFLEPATQFAGRGFSALFVPLDARLPWRTAFGAAIAVGLLAWAWGFALLVRAVEPRRRWVGLLGFGCAFQWSLYLGQYAFVIGSACGFFLLALAIRWTRWHRRRLVVIGLALLLQSFLHVFSAILTGAVLMALSIARARSARERVIAAASLSLAALPAAGLFVLSLLDARHMAATIPDAARLLFLPAGEKLRYLPRCFQPGDRFRGAGIAALCAVGLSRGIASYRRRRGATAIALLFTSLPLLLLAIAGPLNIPGWQLFFPRFLPLGAMLALALVDIERLPDIRWQRAAAAAIAAFTLASIAGAARLHRRLHDRYQDALAGLDAPVRRHLPRLVIVRDAWAALTPLASPVPFLVPMRSLGGLYVAEQGGIVADMFVGSQPIHEFLWRTDHFRDFPDIPDLLALQKVAHRPPSSPDRLAVLNDLAAHGSQYEDVVLYADPADVRTFRDRGYIDDYRGGDLYIGHYRGCRADLVIAGGTGPRAVSYAWWPRAAPTWRRTLGGVTPAGDGSIHVPLDGAPCGEVAIKVEGSGPACREAAADGLLHVRLTAGAPATVRCER